MGMLEKQPPTLVFIGKGFNKSCQPVQRAQRSMISPLEKGRAGTGRVCGAPSAGIVFYGFGKSRDQARLDGPEESGKSVAEDGMSFNIP